MNRLRTAADSPRDLEAQQFVICDLSLTRFRRVSAGQQFDQDHSLLFLSSLTNLGHRMRCAAFWPRGTSKRLPQGMNSLSLETVENCLRTVANVSLDNEKYFCDLDGEMGDADFGKTLADGFRAVLRQLDGDIDRSSIGTFLVKVGSAFAGAAGGTSGPMWGTAFLRAGVNSKDKQTVNLSDLVIMGRAAIAGMMARGNAAQGDKTLLDALIPAVDKLEEYSRTAPGDLVPAFQAAGGFGGRGYHRGYAPMAGQTRPAILRRRPHHRNSGSRYCCGCHNATSCCRSAWNSI